MNVERLRLMVQEPYYLPEWLKKLILGVALPLAVILTLILLVAVVGGACLFLYWLIMMLG